MKKIEFHIGLINILIIYVLLFKCKNYIIIIYIINYLSFILLMNEYKDKRSFILFFKLLSKKKKKIDNFIFNIYKKSLK